jgi:hypothetical protein
MEQIFPPHTVPDSGAFGLSPAGIDGWGVKYLPFNKIQLRPVIRDCIDPTVGLAYIYGSGHQDDQEDNVAYTGPETYDFEFKINGTVVNYSQYQNFNGSGYKEGSWKDVKFKYFRPSLPEGSEDFFSDCNIEVNGYLVTFKRTDSRNGINEDFTVTNEEVSRVSQSVSIAFSSDGDNYVDAPDLGFVFEKVEYEYDIANVGGQPQTYLKKMTNTWKAVFPNEDLIPAPEAGSWGTSLMQFDVTGLRTFFD